MVELGPVEPAAPVGRVERSTARRGSARASRRETRPARRSPGTPRRRPCPPPRGASTRRRSGAPSSSSAIRALKYGRRYCRRAARTASRLVASSEKNHTPGFPSAARTYVRTFSSLNAERRGSGAIPRARSPVIRNGTIPSHALPSNSSISRPAGMYGRSSSTATRQWTKTRLSHVWPITHRPAGSGHARCAVSSTERACLAAAPSTQRTGSGGQMSASCRSERWQSGSPESANGEIEVSSISASAGRRSHWSWCISARASCANSR